MDSITTKVYYYMKSLADKNGFLPTLRQTAEELKVNVHEVEDAISRLHESGKIMITDIPAKSIIEFVDWFNYVLKMYPARRQECS